VLTPALITPGPDVVSPLFLTCAPAFARPPAINATPSVSVQKDLEFIIPH
jgi:hypothetical protein